MGFSPDREERLREVVRRLRQVWSPAPGGQSGDRSGTDRLSGDGSDSDGPPRTGSTFTDGAPVRKRISWERANRLCGDRVRVRFQSPDHVRIAPGDIVPLLELETQGCSICTASAELMRTAVQGRTKLAAAAIVAEVLETIETGVPFNGEIDDERLRADLDSLGALFIHPARQGCARLPWEAIRDALIDSGGSGD